MNKLNLGFTFLIMLFALVIGIAPAYASSSTTATLTIVGLPAGAIMPLRFAPNYTTVDYTATNYTTTIPIYISASTNTTYSGNIPYQWQGAGTTVTYNGVTYTMIGSTYSQLLSVRQKNILGFYVYLNASLWNTNEKAELQSSNASLNTAQLMVASIKNISNAASYNGSAGAGSLLKTASYNGGNITFFSTSIQKAQPNCQINVNGVSYSQQGSYRIPIAIINGLVGIGSQAKNYYWLNGSLVCNNLNALSLNYSIQFGNGTTKNVGNSQITKSLSTAFSYKVPVSIGATITLDASGGANYTALDPVVTTPSNILYYLPITFTNFQNSALASNTPLLIGSTNSISPSGNIIGFSALAYKSYFTSNVNNAEFFFANGTLIKSFLLGNVLNYQQTSNLYTSANLVYLVLIPPGASFLAANTGTATQNTIYLGWAGNVLSGANDLMDGVITGEAPQLSPTYGSADNGNGIFKLYQNFVGTSCPSGWQCGTYGGGGAAYAINNGITITGVNSDTAYVLTTSTYASNSANTIYALGSEVVPSAGSIQIGYASCSNGYGGSCGGLTNQVSIDWWTQAANLPQSIMTNYGGITAVTGSTYGGLAGVNTIYSTQWTGTETANYTHNFGTLSNLNLGTTVGGNAELGIEGDGNGADGYLQWFAVAASAPNSIMPGSTFGTVTYTGLASGGWTASNSLIDQSQFQTLSASVANGDAPYTYNFLVYNSIGKLAFNALYSSSSTSNTFTFQQTVPGGKWTANIIITDNVADVVTNTLTYGVNSLLLGGNPTPSSATIDSGQSILLTANPSAGTGPYSYQWYQSTNQGCFSGPPIYTQIGGATSSTYSASPTSSMGYCYIVTDSANTPVSADSGNTGITVNPTLTISSWIAQLNPIYTGSAQSQTLTAMISGGTSTYTYNFLVYNSINALVYNTLYTGVSTTTNSITFLQQASWGAGNFIANVIVTDSAQVPTNAKQSLAYTSNSGTVPASLTSNLFGNTIFLSVGGNYLINVVGTGQASTHNIGINVIAPGSSPVLVANGIGSTSFNFGPFNSLLGIAPNSYIGNYQLTFNDITSGDPSGGNIIVGYPLEFMNATNTIPYPSNTYVTTFSSNTFYPVQVSANAVSGLTYNLNYTTMPRVYINPTSLNNVYGNVVYTSNTILSGNIIAYNITIKNGATVTLDNSYLLCVQTCNWAAGTIAGGLIGNGGGGTGGSLTSSYGGSGGGAATTYSGGSTLAAGGTPSNPGTTPSAPMISNSNINLWLSNGWVNYFGGAGGGGDTAPFGPGGSGQYGCYVQANVIIAGTTNTMGQSGGTNTDGGGGGGAGNCVFSYQTSFTAGTNSLSGGGVGGGGSPGIGGAGTFTTFKYSTQPVATVNPSLLTQKITVGTGVTSYKYVIPGNYPSAIYKFQTKEMQLGNSIILNATVNINMTDLASLTYNGACSPTVQYLPNCANATFYALPNSWEIVSDKSGNSHLNQTNGDIWSNANIVFTPQVLLNYGNPVWASFIANLTNNPQITNITQSNFQFVTSNIIPGTIYSRKIINMSSYNQSNFQAISATTGIFIVGTLNNYSISNVIYANTTAISNSLSFNAIYIANSLFQNPPVYISAFNTTSSEAGYETLSNNFFGSTINYNTWRTIGLYLVPTSKAAYTGFQVSGCNGQNPTGYTLEILTGLNPNAQTLVQTYKMAVLPFSLWLIAGNIYSFQILTSLGAVVQTFPPTSYGTSITLNVPCVPINVTSAAPIINAVCTTNYTSNTFVCSGSDAQNYVEKWNISILYHPTTLTTAVYSSNIIPGSSFYFSKQLPNQSTEYSAIITASVGRIVDPIYPVLNYLIFPQTAHPTPFIQNGFLFGILLFFIFLAVAWINEVVAVLGFGAILVLGNTIGVFSFPTNFIYALFSLMVFIAIMFMVFKE